MLSTVIPHAVQEIEAPVSILGLGGMLRAGGRHRRRISNGLDEGVRISRRVPIPGDRVVAAREIAGKATYLLPLGRRALLLERLLAAPFTYIDWFDHQKDWDL